jgi:hypothetical protein
MIDFAIQHPGFKHLIFPLQLPYLHRPTGGGYQTVFFNRLDYVVKSTLLHAFDSGIHIICTCYDNDRYFRIVANNHR